MATIGRAKFVVNSDTKQAKNDLQSLATLAQKSLSKIGIDFKIDQKKLQTALNSAAKAVKSPTVKIQAQIKVDKAPKVVVTAQTSKAEADIQKLANKISSIPTVVQTTFTANTTALNAIVTAMQQQLQLFQQITQQINNASPAPTPGSPRAPPAPRTPSRTSTIGAELRQELRNINSDLKTNVTTTAQAEAQLVSFLAQIQSEISALRNLNVLTREQTRDLNQLRNVAGQTADSITRLQKAQALNNARAQAQANKQQQDILLGINRELKIAQSQYDRQFTSLKTYLRTLQDIDARARLMAGNFAAGSREASQLERTIQGLSKGMSRLNDTSITKIRSDLAGARNEFERAIGAAGRFTDKRASLRAYEEQLAQIERRIAGVGNRSTVTANQLRALNQINQQIASQRNLLNTNPSGLGVSGAILTALKQLPQFAAQAGGSLGAATIVGSQFGSTLAGITQTLGPLGLAVAALGISIIGLVGSLSTAIAKFAEFDRNVQSAKATLGLYGAEGQKLGSELAKLAQSDGIIQLGVNSNQAAKGIEELASRGLSAAEILGGGLNTAAKLSAASGIRDLNVAAEVLVGTMRAFGLEGEDAAKIPDLIANAANVSALKIEDFRLAVAAGGGAAKLANISARDFTLTISLMRDRLIGASDAGTAFKSFVQGLTPNSEAAAEAMASIGFSAYDAAGNMRPFMDIIADLAKGLEKLSPREQQTKLEQIFGSDGFRTGVILVDAYNQKVAEGINLLEHRGKQLDTQATADKASIERLDNLADRWEILKNTILVMMQEAGAKVAPMATDIVNGLIDIAQAIRNGGPVWEDLENWIAVAVAGLIALKAQVISTAIASGFAGITGAITRMAGTAGLISGLTGAIRALGAASVATAGVIGGIAVAVGALAAVSMKIRNETDRIYEGIDKSANASQQAVFKKIKELQARGTELSRAQAKQLMAFYTLQEELAGRYAGTKWTGERIYKVDEAAVAKARAEYQKYTAQVKELAKSHQNAATAAEQGSKRTVGAIFLTEVQLKKQESAIKEVRAELAKKPEVFGGTEFDAELQSIEQKMVGLVNKLKESVKDPIKLKYMIEEVAKTETQLKNEARRKFLEKAKQEAAEAEREATRATISAMVDGTAKKSAQLQFDIQEIRRKAQERANAYKSFTKEYVRIINAGELEVRAAIASAGLDQKKELQKAAVIASTGKLLTSGGLTEAQRRAGQADTAELRKQSAILKQMEDNVKRQQTLGRRFYNVNQDFGNRLSKGTVDKSALDNYNQAVTDLNAKIKELPQNLRGAFSKLQTQSAMLNQMGSQMAYVTANLKNWNLAELENTRARVSGQKNSQYTLALLDAEIEKRREVVRTKAAQALAEGKLEARKNNANRVLTDYQAEIDAANGNKQRLLEIERQFNSQVLKARQELAQISAEEEIAQIRRTFQARLNEVAGDSGAEAKLIQQRDEQIQSVRNRRNSEQTRLAAKASADLVRVAEEAKQDILQIEKALQEGRQQITEFATRQDIAEYDRRVENAQDSATELLAVELELGEKILQSRAKIAQLSAERDIQQIRESYAEKIKAAGTNASLVSELEEQRDTLIRQRRQQRDQEFLILRSNQERKILDLSKRSALEILKIEGEKSAGRFAVESKAADNIIALYDATLDAQRDNIVEQARIIAREQPTIVAARQKLAEASYQGEVQATTEHYLERIQKAKGNATEIARLEKERDELLLQLYRNYIITREAIQAKANADRIAAERRVNEEILAINQSLVESTSNRTISEFNRDLQNIERDLEDELALAENNEQKKLEIYRKYEAQRILYAKNAQRERELQAVREENERYRKEKARLVELGLWSQFAEEVERDHQDRLTEIARAGEAERNQITRGVQKDTRTQEQKTNAEKAQRDVENLLKNLDNMNGRAKENARSMLNSWRTTFSAMGIAGVSAVKVIDDAIKNLNKNIEDTLDGYDRLFQRDENNRYINPEADNAAFNQRLGKIGKPETRQDATSKASAQYDEEIKRLRKQIQDGEKALADFNAKGAALTPQQIVMQNLLKQFLPQWKDQLQRAVSAASEAGTKAGDAFDQAAADQAAEAKWGLAQAEYAQQQAISLGLGGAEYRKALIEYRDYWKNRVQTLREALAATNLSEAEKVDLTKQLTSATQTLTSATNLVTKEFRIEGEAQRFVNDQIDALAAARGESVLAYKSEIRALEEAKDKYPEMSQQINKLIEDYQKLQSIRAGISGESISYDFNTGLNSGFQKLQAATTSVAKGFGELISPLGIAAMILEKIDPVGEALAEVLAAIEEPIQALKEPFKLLGQILGAIINANLQTLVPIISAVVEIFATLWDALAQFVKTITLGMVDLTRRPKDDKDDKKDKKDETTRLRIENDLADLERKRREELLTDEEYYKRKQDLVVEQLELERREAIAAAENNESEILEINRKYDRLVLDAKQATIDELDRMSLEASERNRELAKGNVEEELADLENRRKLRLISDKKYWEERYRLTIEKLKVERAAEIAAAEGDAKKIELINRKYTRMEEEARLEMLDNIQAKYQSIAETLQSTLVGGIKNSLMSAARKGNFGAFRTEFRKNLREAMFEAVLGAAIETAAFEAILQPATDGLKNALMTPDTGDDNAAINGLLRAGAKVEEKAKEIYRKLKPLRDAWGITDGENSEQTVTVTGEVSAPEVKVSLEMLSLLSGTIERYIPGYSQAIQAHTPALLEHIKVLPGHTTALQIHAAALPQFADAVTTFGIHTTALGLSGNIYKSAAELFAASVNFWIAAAREHGAAMAQHAHALRNPGTVSVRIDETKSGGNSKR